MAQPADAKIRGDWWAIFNEPELNDLESQLNINNQNLKLYFENYMQARALVGEARAALLPHGDLWPVVHPVANPPEISVTVPVSTPARTPRSTHLPLDISWTPDLFGRIRSQVHEAQYNAQVSAADLENERLVEQADLANFYFEIRGQDALIQLFHQTVA